MMWDGSNFDAHQHASCLRAVDYNCIVKWLKPICFELGFTVD